MTPPSQELEGKWKRDTGTAKEIHVLSYGDIRAELGHHAGPQLKNSINDQDGV